MKFSIIFLFLYLLAPSHSFSQEKSYRSYKFGIEPVFIYKLLEPGPASDGYFGLRFETEKALKKSSILSNNFAAAWSRGPWGRSSMIVNGQVLVIPVSSVNYYYFKYYLSVYPFGKLFRSNHQQGLYIGIGPGIFTSTINKEKYRSGYGFYFVTGLQFYIQKRLSLSLEWELNSTRDITDAQVPASHADVKFLWNGAYTFKIGWIFNKKKKE